jgi:hypothetical protein
MRKVLIVIQDMIVRLQSTIASKVQRATSMSQLHLPNTILTISRREIMIHHRLTIMSQLQKRMSIEHQSFLKRKEHRSKGSVPSLMIIWKISLIWNYFREQWGKISISNKDQKSQAPYDTKKIISSSHLNIIYWIRININKDLP